MIQGKYSFRSSEMIMGSLYVGGLWSMKKVFSKTPTGQNVFPFFKSLPLAWKQKMSHQFVASNKICPLLQIQIQNVRHEIRIYGQTSLD